MSCDCDKKPSCNDATSSDIEVGDTRRIVRTKKDYEAGKSDDTVQVTGNDTANASVLVTLPENPDNGEELTVVAAGAPVTVASEDDTVAGSATVAQGTSTTYQFVAADERCDPGQWIPDCCTPPVIQ